MIRTFQQNCLVSLNFREFGSNFFANSVPIFSRNFRAFAHATSLALFDRFLSFLTDGKNSQIVVNLDLTGFNGRSETREIFILVCLHFEKSLKFGAKPFNGTKKTENRLPLNPSSSIFFVIFRWGRVATHSRRIKNRIWKKFVSLNF